MGIYKRLASIEARLAAANKNVEDLRKQAGIARSTWQRWKVGKTAPNFKTLQAVEDACDILCKDQAA